MANQKISALPPVTSLTGTELIPVVQGGVNKTATPDDVVTFVAAPTSSGTMNLVQLSDGVGGFTSDAGLAYDSGTLTVGATVSVPEVDIASFPFLLYDTGLLQLGMGGVRLDSNNGYLSIAEGVSIALGDTPYIISGSSGVLSLAGSDIQWTVGDAILTIAGDVLPQNTNAFDLGSASLKWQNGFFSKVIHLGADDFKIDAHSSGQLVIGSSGVNTDIAFNAGATTGAIQFNAAPGFGVNIATSELYVFGAVIAPSIKNAPVALGDLGTASDAGAGTRAFISDGLTLGTWGATAVDGGSVVKPVWSNGTNWLNG